MYRDTSLTPSAPFRSLNCPTELDLALTDKLSLPGADARKDCPARGHNSDGLRDCSESFRHVITRQRSASATFGGLSGLVDRIPFRVPMRQLVSMRRMLVLTSLADGIQSQRPSAVDPTLRAVLVVLRPVYVTPFFFVQLHASPQSRKCTRRPLGPSDSLGHPHPSRKSRTAFLWHPWTVWTGRKESSGPKCLLSRSGRAESPAGPEQSGGRRNR